MTLLGKVKKELEKRLRIEKKKFWYNLSPTINSFSILLISISLVEPEP